MEIQFGLNSEDEPKLLYKLQRKLKVFKENTLPNRGYNLITCSSKYGLVFVASPDAILSVYYLKNLIDKECEDPPHLAIKLPESPTHISVNCDFEYLAVTGGQYLNIYNVVNFQNQNVQPSTSIRCDVNPATFVSSLQWNPCIPDTIALAFFDGSLLVGQVNTVQVKKIQSNARCVCWSPKGKQLVVGNNDGTLCQYKPDLTPAKTVPAPDLFKGASLEALAVHWISTYQFAVVYRNSSGKDKPVVAIINTPKAGQPLCLNYEDICYSSGCSRPWYYYLIGVAQWNLILVSSSNSMEIATLGSADGNNWTHWCQIDEARAELPLSDKNQESYPVGLSFDYSAIHRLPWGENETLPPMPLLHVVSHSGLLTIFNIVNLKTDGQICVPSYELILPAEGLVKDHPIDTVQDKQQQSSAPEPDVLEMLQNQGLPGKFFVDQPQTDVQANDIVKIPKFVMPAVETSATVKIPSFSKLQQISTDSAFGSKTEAKAEEIKEVPKHNLNQSDMRTSTPELNAQISQNLKAQNLQQDKKKAAVTIDRELKTMLIKEVNDFQMEHYKFMQKLKTSNIQVLQDLKLIESNPDFQSMSGEKLKQECYLEELRAAVVQLKRELVRSCAVVAEGQSHTRAEDLYWWNQVDSLSNKKMESIKKLIYYIQSQLDQAHRALNYKWKEIYDPNSKKSLPHMIRPILEDVYQPLVKQQKILSRQEAVLKTLHNTLNECDLSPMWKSKSLLRSTPFRNKDSLSKLTNNILNMSIDNGTTLNKSKLSSQKLNALKDMLENYTTIKIKPVNVELHQHLNDIQDNYEKNLKMKTTSEDKICVEEIEKNAKETVPQSITVSYEHTEKKEIPVKVLPTPVSTLRTKVPVESVPSTIFSQSVLHDLQNKDTSTFMGQKICSPTPTGTVNKTSPNTIFSDKQSVSGILSQNSKLSVGQGTQAVLQSHVKSVDTSEPKHFSKDSFVKQSLPLSMQVLNENKASSSVNAFVIKPESITNDQISSVLNTKPLGTSQLSAQNVSNILNANTVKPSFDQSKTSTVETKPSTNMSVTNKTKQPSSDQIVNKVIELKPVVTEPDTKQSLNIQSEKISTISDTLIKVTQSPQVSVSSGIIEKIATSSTNASTKSIFGTPATTQSSIFAAPSPTTTSGNLLLGKPESNIVSSQSGMDNIFRGSGNANNVFGGATSNVFKDKTSFDQPNSVASLSSGQSAFGQQQQKQNSSWGGGNAESTFGSGFMRANYEENVEAKSASEEKVHTDIKNNVKESITQPITNPPTINKTSISTTSSGGQSASEVMLKNNEFSISHVATPVTPPNVKSAETGEPEDLPKDISVEQLSPFSIQISNENKIPSSTISYIKPLGTLQLGVQNVPDILNANNIKSPSQYKKNTVEKNSLTNTSELKFNVQIEVANKNEQPTSGLNINRDIDLKPAVTEPETKEVLKTQQEKVNTLSKITESSQVLASSEIMKASTTPSAKTSTSVSTGVSEVKLVSPKISTEMTSSGPSTLFTSASISQDSIFGSGAKIQTSNLFATANSKTPLSISATIDSTLTSTSSPLTITTSLTTSVFDASVISSQVPPIPSSSAYYATPITLAASVFSNSVNNASSIFGNAAKAAQTSLFATTSVTTTASTGGTTTQTSKFSSPSSTTSKSIFGTSTANTSGKSLFGVTPTTTQSSIFGSPTAATTKSVIFATSNPTTTSGTSLFEMSESNLFAAASISSAPSQSNMGNIFGEGDNTSNVFGGASGTAFGNKTSFAQAKDAASIFSGQSAFGQQKQEQQTNLWGGGSTTSAFGSSFNQPNQTSSVFGGGGVVSSGTAQAFGSPTGAVSQSPVFGTPQQSASSFGGSPDFGSKSAFGQGPSFGGSPGGGGAGAFGSFGGFNKSPSSGFGAPATFGGVSTFGNTSPGKSFGGGAAGFGATTQSNATFESLATQNTLTFGNLAQQSAQQTTPAFSNSPSFTGWRS